MLNDVLETRKASKVRLVKTSLHSKIQEDGTSLIWLANTLLQNVICLYIVKQPNDSILNPTTFQPEATQIGQSSRNY